jgi:membrane glycosyltransferase
VTPPSGDRTSLSWRFTAWLSPEILALILVVVVVVLGGLAIVAVVLPHPSAA